MHVRAFLLQLHDIAKRKDAERYMECCPRRCQGLREVLEEAARAGLRYKESLPLHLRLVQEEREEWEEAVCKRQEEIEEKVRKMREVREAARKRWEDLEEEFLKIGEKCYKRQHS